MLRRSTVSSGSVTRPDRREEHEVAQVARQLRVQVPHVGVDVVVGIQRLDGLVPVGPDGSYPYGAAVERLGRGHDVVCQQICERRQSDVGVHQVPMRLRGERRTSVVAPGVARHGLVEQRSNLADQSTGAAGLESEHAGTTEPSGPRIGARRDRRSAGRLVTAGDEQGASPLQGQSETCAVADQRSSGAPCDELETLAIQSVPHSGGLTHSRR